MVALVFGFDRCGPGGEQHLGAERRGDGLVEEVGRTRSEDRGLELQLFCAAVWSTAKLLDATIGRYTASAGFLHASTWGPTSVVPKSSVVLCAAFMPASGTAYFCRFSAAVDDAEDL